MNVKSRYLLIVLALVGLNFAAASATAARPEWVKPPAFASDDVDARMRECLLVIARKLAPDERLLQGKIKQSTRQRAREVGVRPTSSHGGWAILLGAANP